MKQARTLLTATALAFALAAPAPHAANLIEVYNLALQSDPQLAAAEAKFRTAAFDKPIARAALLPKIDAYASVEHIDQQYRDVPEGRSTLYKDDTFGRTTYGVTLDQALIDQERWARLELSDARVRQAEADLKAQRQALFLRVAEAYFDVLAAQDNLNYASAERAAIEKQLRQTRERLAIGTVAITDVKEAEAQFDLAVAQEIDARYQLTTVKENLGVIVGATPAQLDPLKANVELVPPQPNDVASWVETALANSLALQSATQGVEVAKREISRARSGHYPTLSLKAEHGVQDDDGGFSEGVKTDSTLALKLNLPLYSGGQVQAQVGQAYAQQDQAEANHELVRRDVTRQTRAAYLNVLSAIARVKALKKALDSTQHAAEAATTGFQVGTRTAVDVVLALRETYRAQRDHIRAHYDYILASLKLKQATGTLSLEDLQRINGLLSGAAPGTPVAQTTPATPSPRVTTTPTQPPAFNPATASARPPSGAGFKPLLPGEPSLADLDIAEPMTHKP